MNFKKTLPACLLLCAMMTAAVSCGGGGDTTTTTPVTEAAGSDTAAVTEAVTDDRPALGLPETDFGGKPLRILGYELGVDCIHQYDFYYDEASAGDLIADAIHARNMLIEERYNCTIEVTNDKAPATTARNSITAGSDDFDVMELYINNAMSMAMEGMFMNWYDLPSIKMDAP